MSNNNDWFLDDILIRYDELIYNFEYGFNWDKAFTMLLGKKGAKSYRETENILKKYIYDGVTIIKYNKKNFARKIVSKQPYSLKQNFWFQNLYGCYGMINNGYGSIKCEMDINDTNKNQISGKRNSTKKKYSHCRGNSDELENGKCEYKRACDVCADAEAVLLLKNGIEKREKNDYLSNKAMEFYRSYPDMTEDKEEKLYLKENLWTRDQMQSILPGERYDRFLEWISFFSVFSPLSVLGSNFLWKLREPLQNRFFFIRGLEVGTGLMQESIYRCLCAIHQKKVIIYDKNKYTPIRLYYKNNKMDVKNADLYLEAERDGIFYQLPLKGHYIYVGNKLRKEIKKNIEKKESKTIDYTVEFYTNSAENNGEITSYLDQRRNGIWQENRKTQTKMNDQIMHSPYYPKNERWEVWQETYQIKEEDQEGFRRYIMSFGEFAKCADLINRTSSFIDENEAVKQKSEQKGMNPPEYSLCNIFSAKGILDEDIKPFRQLKEMTLPPSEAELAWLDFIIQNYKNMSQIFLSKEELEEIHKKMNENIQKKWFETSWDCQQKVRDCRLGVIHNYKKIYDTIRQRRCFQYRSDKRSGGDETVIVLPYAMEFNVSKYLETSQDHPFQIMCYDWKQKRNCLVLYKDLKTKETVSVGELMQREPLLHRLYHILAYAVRSALEKREEIDHNVNKVIEVIWKKESRQKNTNYERYIAKKVKNYRKSYKEIYENIACMIAEHPMKQEIEEFVQNVFSYWNEDGVKTNLEEMKYHTILLESFGQACNTLKNAKRKDALVQELELFQEDDILTFILGEDGGLERNDPYCSEKLLGESAYYNEKLKLRKVSFSLINNEKKDIDCIYSIFKSYICKGSNDNEKICFEVSYERFNYRDIHKNLMAVRDLIDIESITDIESSQPGLTRDTIQKRIKAVEENQ